MTGPNLCCQVLQLSSQFNEVYTQFHKKTAIHLYLFSEGTFLYRLQSSSRSEQNLRKRQLYTYLASERTVGTAFMIAVFEGVMIHNSLWKKNPAKHTPIATPSNFHILHINNSWWLQSNVMSQPSFFLCNPICMCLQGIDSEQRYTHLVSGGYCIQPCFLVLYQDVDQSTQLVYR